MNTKEPLEAYLMWFAIGVCLFAFVVVMSDVLDTLSTIYAPLIKELQS